MTTNLQIILAVALGGALGSVARYLFNDGATRLFGNAFSWGIFLINIIGSFLIGVFVEMFALKWDLSPPARAFLTVGICGGFTTFSTFSLDAWVLIERGDWGLAMAYIAGSVVLSIGALVAGLQLVRATA